MGLMGVGLRRKSVQAVMNCQSGKRERIAFGHRTRKHHQVPGKQGQRFFS
jgi:hypothetical protein